MANIKSQKKRILTNEKARLRNKAVKSALKTHIRKFLEAAAEGDHALELSPDDPLMLYNVACLFAQLREIERAIAALDRSITAGYWDIGWMAHDPDLDPLRDHPRFRELTVEH